MKVEEDKNIKKVKPPLKTIPLIQKKNLIKIEPPENSPDKPKKRAQTSSGLKKRESDDKNKEIAKKVNPSFSKSEKNSNYSEIAHLMKNCPGISIAQVTWSYDLRSYKFINPEKKKSANESMNARDKKVISPPPFYEEDLKKFIKRKKINRPSSTNPNYAKIRHLVRNLGDHGASLNDTQFNYATNLRMHKLYEGIYKNPHQWKDPAYKLKLNDEIIFPSDKKKEAEKEQDNSAANENVTHKKKYYCLRPYVKVRDEVVVGKDNIKRTKLVPNKDFVYGNFGDHLALKPYSSLYQDANTFTNWDVLQKHSNQTCLFELGLRTRGAVVRNKVKRKPKTEMEKVKEEAIKLKQQEFKKMYEKCK